MNKGEVLNSPLSFDMTIERLTLGVCHELEKEAIFRGDMSIRLLSAGRDKLCGDNGE
jgi:hypothetical protein